MDVSSSRISRRVFAQGLGAVPMAVFGATEVQAQSRVVAELLAAVADLIVPRDRSPSASDLDVHHRILAQARTIPNYPRLLSEGLGWLEQQARGRHGAPFLQLPAEVQARILTAAFAAQPQTLPRVFADRMRADVLATYYRDARAWAGTGFEQPIQPMGYPDFQDPPA
ncbi:MAG: hypothetical protein RIR62_258 [Pseudomonadota bacterium]|jgi:hypothetical protein